VVYSAAMSLDARAVKKESERVILAAGGKILDWLPDLEVNPTSVRPRDEVVARALVLNAMIQIAFQAPIPVIASWIDRRGLRSSLVDSERAILRKSNAELTKQEQVDLNWSIEALWALLWTGALTDDLPFDEPVPDTMAGLCPNLQRDEDGSKFDRFRLRPYDALLRMLDLYFRLHRYARQGQLTHTPTPPVDPGIILERRKALAWVLDPANDWDNVDLST
jgi:uncharacterized protein DUF4272